MTKKTHSCWNKHILSIAVVAVFCSGLFSRCANIAGSPEGGPKDTLPPRVVGMNPKFNSTNLRPSKIVIEFDEYIQLKDQSKEFFTSPFMQTKPSLLIKNKKIEVTVTPPLDSAQTYVFNIGSAVVDNNEGNVLHGLKFTFSTGPSVDSMYMSGYVSNALTADTVKGAYILFYDAERYPLSGLDSLPYNLRKASALSKTMSDGGFVFANLKPIDYRVYAFLDNNGNNMYDPGQDEIAFLDTVYNPAKMPSFSMWYDSIRMHWVSEHQLFFNSFVEEPDRRQNLSSFDRPSAREIVLKFSAKNPKIEKFELKGIDPSKVMVEQPKVTRDSILYWLDIPQEELPDTIVGKLAYQRHDSVGRLYLHEQDLRLVWKKPFVALARRAVLKPRFRDLIAMDSIPDSLELSSRMIKRLARYEKRRLKRERKNPPPVLAEETDDVLVLDEIPEETADSIMMPVDTFKTNFKYTMLQDRQLIPNRPPVLTFSFPLRRFPMDSVRFYITRAEKGVDTRKDIPFTIEQDSLRIREYTLRADWEEGGNYSLMIPRGALENIAGEINDTIRHDFLVARKADMGTVILNMTNAPGTEYVIQVMDEKGTKVLLEKARITRTDTIHYITPGKIRLRLIQDLNRNGKWDAGILTRRIQPEVVRWYLGGKDRGVIDLPAKRPFVLDIDLEELFLPRVFTGSEPEPEIKSESEEEVAAGEMDQAGISNVKTSDGGMETFETIDFKTLKKMDKAARKAARQAAKKGAPADHDHDHGSEGVIPADELEYMQDERPH